MRLAVIPARGGSVRVPGKNIKMFGDKRIIEYSIEAIRKADLFDLVVVSTDDQKIKEVAGSLQVKVVNRPSRFSMPHIGTDDVTAHAIEYLEREHGAVNYACCVYATAPMMLAEDIRKGFELLTERGADYAYAVNAETRKDAGQFYWGTRGFFMDPGGSDNRVVFVPIEAKRCCDINEPGDWDMALRMYAELHPDTA